MEINGKHFEFLDRLRESGKTNMFGARPYVQKKFGLDSADATVIVTAWMETFDGETSVTERVKKSKGGN